MSSCLPTSDGALAQGYERYLHTVEVTGSNPVRPTTPIENSQPIGPMLQSVRRCVNHTKTGNGEADIIIRGETQE